MKKLIAVMVLGLAQPILAQPAAAPSAITPASQAASENPAHAELRALKDRLVAALNARDVDALVAELDPEARITTMDSVLSKGPEGARAYYARMMTGATRLVEDMKLEATPDDLSVLYSDGAIAVTTGTANAHFKLATGNEMDVPLRWTATSARRDGAWKITSAQFGADMFDNPVLSAASNYTWYVAGAAGLIGLVAGWLFGRRRRPA